MEAWNERTLRLVGAEGVSRLGAAHVLVAGVGGVGGYATEMLARAGVGHLTLVDADTVAPSNLNRQIIALRSTLGEPKTAVMAARIADINPDCRVTVRQQLITPDNAAELLTCGPDYVADCIDSVAAKTALLLACVDARIRVISSMGAGGRLDPTRVQYADLWETQQDGLARAVRQAMKRLGRRPRIPVVFSPEPPRQSPEGFGTIATLPAVFGIYIANKIIQKILRRP